MAQWVLDSAWGSLSVIAFLAAMLAPFVLIGLFIYQRPRIGKSGAVGLICPPETSPVRVLDFGRSKPGEGGQNGGAERSLPRWVVEGPKCRSEQVSGGRKGPGLGKAAAGGLLAGPVGLVAGMFGRKKPLVTCLNCGHRWEPGEG